MRWQNPQGNQISRRGYPYQAQRTLVIPSHQPRAQPQQQLEQITPKNAKVNTPQRSASQLQVDNRVQAQAN